MEECWDGSKAVDFSSATKLKDDPCPAAGRGVACPLGVEESAGVSIVLRLVVERQRKKLTRGNRERDEI